MAEGFIDDPLIRELNDSVISLQEEKQRIVAMLIRLKLENLRLRSANSLPKVEDDTLNQSSSDSDSSGDFDKEMDEFNRDTLEFAYELLLKDCENDKRRFEDTLAEKDQVIEELKRKLSVLPSMEEQIVSLEREKKSLIETLHQLTATHQQEISALNHKLDDLNNISDHNNLLESTINELSHEKESLEIELQKVKNDTGGRKLSGSSEAYELVQLRKTNESLRREIEELNDRIYRRNEASPQDDLTLCGKIIENCLKDGVTTMDCPLCGANVPGKNCVLCVQFGEIMKLKEQLKKQSNKTPDGIFPQAGLFLLIGTILFVIIQCWFLL